MERLKKGDRIRVREKNKFWKGAYYVVKDTPNDYDTSVVSEARIFSPDVHFLDFHCYCMVHEAEKCRDQKIESLKERIEIINKHTHQKI